MVKNSKYHLPNSTTNGNLCVGTGLESSRTSKYAAVLRSVPPVNSSSIASFALVNQTRISQTLIPTLLPLRKGEGNYKLYNAKILPSTFFKREGNFEAINVEEFSLLPLRATVGTHLFVDNVG